MATKSEPTKKSAARTATKKKPRKRAVAKKTPSKRPPAKKAPRKQARRKAAPKKAGVVTTVKQAVGHSVEAAGEVLHKLVEKVTPRSRKRKR
ncbi:MAG: hypothetical protein ACR2OZ_08810 [Verrucomicrobiales bacterium]